jgi:hypothetical protein
VVCLGVHGCRGWWGCAGVEEGSKPSWHFVECSCQSLHHLRKLVVPRASRPVTPQASSVSFAAWQLPTSATGAFREKGGPVQPCRAGGVPQGHLLLAWNLRIGREELSGHVGSCIAAMLLAMVMSSASCALTDSPCRGVVGQSPSHRPRTLMSQAELKGPRRLRTTRCRGPAGRPAVDLPDRSLHAHSSAVESRPAG